MSQGSIDALVCAVLSPLRLVLERASVALLLLSTLSALVWASLGPAPWLQWPASLALLWACLGICWINRNHHQEKRKIIEGMLVPEQARWLSSAKGMSWPVLLLAHILLLCALVLTLRLLAGAAGTAIFKPAPSSLQMWALYTFDLLCKAALFDIPEVYKIALSSALPTEE